MIYNLYPCIFDLRIGIKMEPEISPEISFNNIPADLPTGLSIYFIEAPNGEIVSRATLVVSRTTPPETFDYVAKGSPEKLKNRYSEEFKFLVEPILEDVRTGNLKSLGEKFSDNKMLARKISEGHFTGDFFMSVKGAIERSCVLGAAIDSEYLTGQTTFLWSRNPSKSLWASANDILNKQKTYSKHFVENLKNIKSPDPLLFGGFVNIVKDYVMELTAERNSLAAKGKPEYRLLQGME